MHSWRVLVLPYIDGQQLYDRYDFSQPWNSPHNQAIANEMPAVFRFHNVDDDTTTNTNYLAVVGEHTFWPRGGGRTRESITDDWQTTIVVVENTGAGIHWMEPRDLDFDTMTYKWNQPAGISSWYDAPTVLTMTKPLKKIDPSIRPDVLRAMLTVDGGETVSEADESWQLLEDGRDRPTVR